MRSYLKYNIFILITFVLTANSQIPQLKSTKGDQYFFKSIIQDVKSSTDYTFSSISSDFLEAAAYAGLTSVMLLGSDLEFDEEYGIEKEYGPIGIPKVLGNIGEVYDRPGPLYFAMGFAGALYGTGQILNNQKLLETTNLMARSLIVTGIFTTALKMMIGRARPYKNDNPHVFRPFNFKMNSDYMSMPSGHTSSIFAMMTVIAKQYNSWYIKIPAYTFATSVAFQRMNNRKHWTSDLFVGATIGYLVGSTIVERHRASFDGFTVQPVINATGVGIAVQF